MPKRIQLKRTKGWRKPKGAVVVSRPSKWGNPYKMPSKPTITHKLLAVGHFRIAIEDWIDDQGQGARDEIEELRGKDLCCWCPLDQPCHADVLLQLANKEKPMP